MDYKTIEIADGSTSRTYQIKQESPLDIIGELAYCLNAFNEEFLKENKRISKNTVFRISYELAREIAFTGYLRSGPNWITVLGVHTELRI